MEVQIIEHIEFSEDKCEDVVFIGIVIKTRNDGTFIEDVQWDKTLFTKEENNLIASKAFASKMYDRFFKAFESEMNERLIECYI